MSLTKPVASARPCALPLAENGKVETVISRSFYSAHFFACASVLPKDATCGLQNVARGMLR